jgi:hypothetical protein
MTARGVARKALNDVIFHIYWRRPRCERGDWESRTEYEMRPFWTGHFLFRQKKYGRLCNKILIPLLDKLSNYT